MTEVLDETQVGTNRRSFIKEGIVTAAGATFGAGLLTDISRAIAKDDGLKNTAIEKNVDDPQAFDHRFAAVNGIRLHYVEEGQGPLVILLHGYPFL
jgi:hypothetical protein